MRAVASNISVAEYCEAMADQKVIVNHDYQRSDKVWPPLAQSFLIETILLGFPMPKLALNQILDLRSKQTIREIVDGQQRSRAISAFFRGDLRLSRAIEMEGARGRRFDELDDELKSSFLTYPLSYDLFTNTTPEEIREVFRRINLYTVPLNPEEQRHAIYQGEFKVYIYHLSRSFSQPLKLIGVMTDKNIVRMQDAKLFTEITHACMNGITTTSKRSLDALYRANDKVFDDADYYIDLFTYAIDRFLEMSDLFFTSLMRPYHFYSLALAIMHLYSPQDKLQRYFPVQAPSEFDTPTAIQNLSALADALDSDDPVDDEFEEFVLASTSRTNVASQRQTRFQWMCRALTEPSL